MNDLVVDPAMSFATYNADPCPEASLRASMIATISNFTLFHARHEHPRLNTLLEEEQKKEFDLGAAAHEFVVGGEDRVRIVHATTKEGKVCENYQSPAARAARDRIRAEGGVPVFAHQLVDIRAMADALRAQLDERGLEQVFVAGCPEVSILWREDVWFRIRPDWMAEPSAQVVFDYKTCGVPVSPRSLGRHAFNQGWDIKAALIAMGMRRCGVRDPEVVFIAQENFAPYRMNHVDFGPLALAEAEQEIDRAARGWRAALDSGRWPAYPLRRTTLDPPGYLSMSREFEREEGYQEPTAAEHEAMRGRLDITGV